MDPNETMRIMSDSDSTKEESKQAACDLWNWLAKGGFPPSGMSAVQAKAEAKKYGDALKEWEERREHHCNFIEVELPDGTSVNVGEWINRGVAGEQLEHRSGLFSLFRSILRWRPRR